MAVLTSGDTFHKISRRNLQRTLMALILNPYAHNTAGNTVGGILSLIKTRLEVSGSLSIKVYPASVAYPSLAVRVAGTAQTGFLGTASFAAPLAISGVNLIGITGGTFTPTVTGTVAWAFITTNQGQTIFTDSVGLPGAGAVITLTTLNLVAGTPATLAFSLRA